MSSVCLLCRSFLLREQPNVIHLPPPPILAHTTQEILQLSSLARAVSVYPEKRVPQDDTSAPETSVRGDQDSHRHERAYISHRLSKKTLQLLPPCKFPGKIFHIRHPGMEEEYTDIIRKLLRNRVLGFDVECSWTSSRPILVQLASRELCVLWQVKQWTSLPTLLHGILSSPHYLKVGHGSLGDARALLTFYAVNTVNIFDTHKFLTSLPPHLRPPLLNLQGLVGIFLGWWLSKSMTRSKWDRRQLSWKQLRYASTDVWASLEVYLALMKYASDIEVIPPPPPVECTLRMCKPHLIKSLEQTLKKNMAQSERARLSVEKLIGAGEQADLLEPAEEMSNEHLNSHSIQCALDERNST